LSGCLENKRQDLSLVSQHELAVVIYATSSLCVGDCSGARSI
jgi:hypothetical protein